MQATNGVTTLTPRALLSEARGSVRGLGKYLRHELEVRNTGCRLVVYFVRHYNPNRPLHVQAVESTTVTL